MKRVKNKVGYWCDDIVQRRYLGRGDKGCHFWIPELHHTRIFKIKYWYFEIL